MRAASKRALGLAVRAARAAIAQARERIQAGGEAGDVRAAAVKEAESLAAGSLVRVINATGVIVHTNLGRAPLAEAACAAIGELAGGYSNLEYDLERGERGSRQAHAEAIVCELAGAEAALVVNNCAAAVLLACAALAQDREVVVSRGQLVEIGGSFRIPDVIAQSGARLVEVGTTNRTRLSDYARALGPESGAILRAHPSNFRMLGFVEDVTIEALCGLARDRGVPVIDDAGSGVLAEGVPELAEEPAVRRSVAAGAALTCFSADKLLGGPQAGVIAGTEQAISACCSHPLARALRIDKLSLAALTATLRLYLDPKAALREVPVLRMLTAAEPELLARAESIRDGIGDGATVISSAAKVGGGALPLLELEGPVCALDPAPLSLDDLAGRLRRGDPAVVGRARDGWLLLDPRTIPDADVAAVVEAVRRAR